MSTNLTPSVFSTGEKLNVMSSGASDSDSDVNSSSTETDNFDDSEPYNFQSISSDEDESDINCVNYSENVTSFHREMFSEDMLIYDGAQISVGTSMLLTMTFVLNHNLTGECFSDLLDLLCIHCKSHNLLPTSLYSFNKWFRNLKTSPIKHRYCSNCLLKLKHGVDKCIQQKCKDLLIDNKCVSFYVEVPIEDQLKKLLFESKFRSELCHANDRNKTVSGNIEDI